MGRFCHWPSIDWTPMTEPDGDDKSELYRAQIIRWIEAQPPGRVVDWTSASITREEPTATGFVDIEVPELQDELKVKWLWTIVDVADPEPPHPLVIHLDKDVESGWTPDRISRALDRWVLLYTDRVDIRFRWDPDLDSVLIELLKDRL